MLSQLCGMTQRPRAISMTSTSQDKCTLIQIDYLYCLMLIGIKLIEYRQCSTFSRLIPVRFFPVMLFGISGYCFLAFNSCIGFRCLDFSKVCSRTFRLDEAVLTLGAVIK